MTTSIGRRPRGYWAVLTAGVVAGGLLARVFQPEPAIAQGRADNLRAGPIEQLSQRIDDLEAGNLAELEERLAALEELLAHVHLVEEDVNGLTGPHLVIHGCNLHVRNATGSTDLIDGTGNLVVGYNEISSADYGRTGSHNLVVGRGHEYSSYGGFIAGEQNAVTGPAASVSGGISNFAGGDFTSVSGGTGNSAVASFSSVSGGALNLALGDSASIGGGFQNIASGSASSVSGGHTNVASGDYASVSGGFFNLASGNFATVSGGNDNVASHVDSTVSGGLGSDTAADGDHVP